MSALPDAWRTAPTLQGRHVRLEVLRAEHADGLREALAGDELADLWYTNVPRAADVDGWLADVLAQQAQGRWLAFVVRDAAGAIVGTTRFYDMDTGVPRLSIGYTWYAPRVQRTGLNTEAKLLLFGHAFDTLGCISVVLETSWFNHRSRTSIARLGARQDGVMRNHRRHADGTVRDSVIFSILDTEWPAVRSNLLARLAHHEQDSK
ncbi:GNAT family N-acetyltransferase [Pseudoxanthomonas japonensis]|uniref:GNAT family N-acetyltransferase n=1 Tax=Pseudoxanthomonas japonensis TaxID=69284 RepID=UPI001BCECA0D|nr:GNAT family protein [Pseudoxanthomonas japonensis]